MRKLLSIALLLSVATITYGQQTVGSGHWQYERYNYFQCGREYCGYRPVFVQDAITPAAVAAKAVEAANVNHDNSVSYTYNITYGNQSQIPVAQGSTLYGYSYSSVADVYGNTDIGALYNMAIRLAGDQNALAEKANTNAMSLVAQAGRERARVAEILAKGQVIAQANTSAAALANSISAANSATVEVRTNTQNQTHSSDGGYEKPSTEPGPAIAAGSVQQVFNNRCVSCHKEGNEKGGLRLDDASKLAPADVHKILSRITTTDASARMPRTSGDKPATLTVEELAVLFKAATN